MRATDFILCCDQDRWAIMKVKMLEVLFCLIQKQRMRRWWLSNIGSGRGADEEFPLSSLTQGYGPILLNSHFYFHHQLFSLSCYSNPILIANSGCCHSSHAGKWSATAIIFTRRPLVSHNHHFNLTSMLSCDHPWCSLAAQGPLSTISGGGNCCSLL